MATQYASVYGTPQTFTAFTWTTEGAGTVTEVIDNVHLMNALSCVVNITAIGGAPTLNLYLQKELPGGTYTDIASFTQITGVATRYCDIIHRATIAAEAAVQDAALTAGTVNALIFGKSLRLKAVIGGSSTPTVTGTVKITFYRYDK